MKKLKEISDRIGELVAEGEISEELFFFENWMSEQLKQIKKFKQKTKPLFYNQQIFDTICLNSELITGFDFKVIKHTGFFSYLFTVGRGEQSYPFNFLDLIKQSYKAEFLAFFKENETAELNFLFETRIQTSALIGFKVILKVKSLWQKRQFRITIKNIQAEEENKTQVFWGFQDENTLEQSGISLLLFGNNYSIIDLVGCEVLAPKDKNAATLVAAYNPEHTKRIYPFINRALKGLFNSGEVRIKGSVFNVHAFPVKDENGFTNATVLLTKENF